MRQAAERPPNRNAGIRLGCTLASAVAQLSRSKLSTLEAEASFLPPNVRCTRRLPGLAALMDYVHAGERWSCGSWTGLGATRYTSGTVTALTERGVRLVSTLHQHYRPTMADQGAQPSSPVESWPPAICLDGARLRSRACRLRCLLGIPGTAQRGQTKAAPPTRRFNDLDCSSTA